jgi:hypothetical protein
VERTGRPAPVVVRSETADILAVQARLTDRDRTIIDWLDRHGVLTTAQLTAALFTSPTTAAHRLAKLRAIGVVDRFHHPWPGGGFGPWHWVIGPMGARIAAASRNTTPPTSRALQARHDRLTASPTLAHLLGTNQFFIDLYAHTRTNPHAQLVRWWSEHDTARRYHRRIHPDGHALWRDHDHDHGHGHGHGRDRDRRIVIGIFLEYDRGTEDLWRLVRKLAAYDQIAAEGGACYPVLFWLHSTRREAGLHAEFARRRPAGLVPVATAVRDPADLGLTQHRFAQHDPERHGFVRPGPAQHGPAGPVWALVGDPTPRRTLAGLPFDHGDPVRLSPNLQDPTLDRELDPEPGQDR